MDTPQGHLLVVEDIPDILKLLEATLTFKGHRVVTARNGEEALEAIGRERPALVITDILMPKMDAVERPDRQHAAPLPVTQVVQAPNELHRGPRAPSPE